MSEFGDEVEESLFLLLDVDVLGEVILDAVSRVEGECDADLEGLEEEEDWNRDNRVHMLWEFLRMA